MTEEAFIQAGRELFRATEAPPGESRRRAVPDDVPALTRRPVVRGKTLEVGGRKLYVRGSTYGTFAPGPEGLPFPERGIVERDLAQIARAGMNAVRVYTVPPTWLLDAAAARGLRVLVGLPWEQHVTFLKSSKRVRDIRRRAREGVRSCVGHPAVLGYVIGNEIPASIVRWHGRRRVERFLERLYLDAKDADPDGLVTYVNFPTTEYLELPFLDFACFNVFLERREALSAYLARLQNLVDEKPLVIAELGLDSKRNGEEAQAEVLRWQLATAFEEGAAGAFVFSWTDEWHRGGYAIENWDFGLTTRDRCPKPALESVRAAFQDLPLNGTQPRTKVSVVVCSYNGSRTIRETLEALQRLDYPDFEVIVIDDGSTDTTAEIALEYDVRLVSTPNNGLSTARNIGMREASGDIVAYIDDDAYPDPHWLSYLVRRLEVGGYAAIGGPNLIPPHDGRIAQCVGNSPGGPNHVLLNDREAEHVPGCNMAFRKDRLEALGGFDPRFRAAGDDVDLCWRVQAAGWKIGFHPAAIVWHHRRDRVGAYLRQQFSYGKAEALLERKWPEKYNSVGHLAWAGRIYGRGLTHSLLKGRPRVYHGSWGSAPFQSLYERHEGTLRSLALMPEFFIAIAGLGALSVAGLWWSPLLAALPLLVVALGIVLGQAILSARNATYRPAPRLHLAWMRVLTALLHLAQPIVRLYGRLKLGLTLWRKYPLRGWTVPRARLRSVWTQDRREPEGWLSLLEKNLRARQVPVHRGGAYDLWDLKFRAGGCGGARASLGVEEHGSGRQFLRFRVRPWVYRPVFGFALVLAGLGLWAAADGAWPVAVTFLAFALGVFLRTIQECGTAVRAMLEHVDALALSEARPPVEQPVPAADVRLVLHEPVLAMAPSEEPVV